MSKYEWNLLNDKDFELLIQELLYYEIPHIALLNRVGKDAGIDAVLKDGEFVYQMKYVSSLKLEDTVKQAKKDLNKIREYKKKGNQYFRYWENVNHWTLISPVDINRNDLDKLNRLKEEYKDLQMRIEFWGTSEIEPMLNQNYYLVEAFFHGSNKCFQTLNEMKDCTQKVIFNQNFARYNYVGQEKGIDLFNKFIKSNSRFLFITGVYSIGKSRFLFECGKKLCKKDLQVYIGQTNIMESSNNWMKTIYDTDTTRYLLIDEPDINLIKRLYEVFSSDRCKYWKVILTLSKPKFIEWEKQNQRRYDTEFIYLNSLNKDQSLKMIDNYHNSCGVRAKNNIYKLTKGIPGIINLFFEKNEKGTNNFNNENDIFIFIIKHINNYINSNNNKKIILRYLSVWNKIEFYEGSNKIDYLSKIQNISKEEIIAYIEELVNTDIVTKSGVNNSYYYIDPKLIRLSILREWFIDEKNNEYKPNVNFSNFIDELINSKIPDKSIILENLSEFIVYYQTEKHSNRLWSKMYETIKKSITKKGITIFDQIIDLDIIKKICYLSPDLTFSIIEDVLTNPGEDFTYNHPIFGEQSYNKTDLLNKILDVIKYLINNISNDENCVIAWNRIKNLYNKILRISIDFIPTFETNLRESLKDIDVYSKFCNCILRSLEDPLSKFDLNIIIELMSSAKNFSYFSDNIITYSSINIHNDLKYRNITCKAKQILFKNIKKTNSSETRIKLLSTLNEVHSNWRLTINNCNEPLIITFLNNEILKDLSNIYDYAFKKENKFTNSELILLRNLWQYYLSDSTTSKDLNNIANKCETALSKIINYKYYKYFLFGIAKDEKESIIDEIKRTFQLSASPKNISSFFDSTWKYILQNNISDNDISSFAYDISKSCFELYNDNINYQSFVGVCFKKTKNILIEYFSIYTLRQLIINLKAKRKFNTSIFSELNLQKELIYKTYLGANQYNIGKLNKSELYYFLKTQIEDNKLFDILPIFINVDFNTVKRKIETIFPSCSNDFNKSFISLVNNIYYSIISSQSKIHKSIFDWMINNLFIKYNLDSSIFYDYRFKILFEICSTKITQSTFYKLIANRIELEKIDPSNNNIEIWPNHFDIKYWVSEKSSKKAIIDLCKIVVFGETFISLFLLPSYLAYMDKNGKVISQYISKYLNKHSSLNPKELFGLARLISGFDDNSSEWRLISEPIFIYLSKINDSSLKSLVFIEMQPKIKSFDPLDESTLDCLIKKKKQAEILFNIEPLSSPFFEYRKWSLNNAVEEYNQYIDLLEEERNE